MKKKNLIIVIASCVMLLAFLVFAYIKFGDKSTSMFDMMKNDAPIMAFLILLLLLLSPIYLLLDSFRENLKKNIPVVEKIVIPEKVALLLPLILFFLYFFYLKSMPLIGDLMKEGTYGLGFYLYLLAGIAVAVLPWVKSPILEEKV